MAPRGTPLCGALVYNLHLPCRYLDLLPRPSRWKTNGGFLLLSTPISERRQLHTGFRTKAADPRMPDAKE